MKYTIHAVNESKVGDITFNTGKLTYVKFEKDGGTLNEGEVGFLNVFKRAGKWANTVFLRAVTSGRIKIVGDKELESLFASDVPAAKKPGNAPAKTQEQKIKEIQDAQAKLAALMADLEPAKRKKAE